MIASGHQPNYLPWLGFFDKMRQCDVFVIEDNVQFEQQGFMNRNRVRTFDGVRWLTVPVKHIGRPLSIDEIEIANDAEPDWGRRHWRTLECNYSKAPFWDKYSDFFEGTYSREWQKLIDLNMHVIRGIMHFLKIDRRLVTASSLGVSAKGSELVLAQCKALGAKVHLSGIGGRNYLNLESFQSSGIEVIFQDFQYPVYPQLHGQFVPDLSVVDFLFCTGGETWGD
jgi:hypothetical protein